MMQDKGLNLFDECAAECVYTFAPSGRIVYLFFLRGQLTVHTWHHSKFTEDVNKNGAIAKVRILVKQVILKGI